MHKTPIFLQMAKADCGATSLGIILAYYGCFVSLTELRETTETTIHGISVRTIVTTAKQYGLDAKPHFYSVKELVSCEQPVIVFWQKKHFLVVEGFEKNTVYINDPAKGRYQLSMEDFIGGYSSVAITLSPNKQFKKRKQQYSVAKQIVARLSTEKKAIAFVCIATLILTVLSITIPAFTRVFIDDYLISHQKNWIKPLLLIMAGIIAIQFIVTYLQGIVLKRIETKLAISLSKNFISHLLKLPFSFFSSAYPGDIITRIQANHNLSSELCGQLGLSIIGLFQATIFLIFLFIYNIPLTLVTTALIAINFILYSIIKPKRELLSIANRNKLAQLTTKVISGLAMIDTIKISGFKNRTLKDWQNAFISYLNNNQELGVINAIMSTIPTITNFLVIIATLALGSWLVIHQRFTIGGILAFQMLAQYMTNSITSFMVVSGNLQKITADMIRLHDINECSEDTRYKINKKIESKPLSGSVEFKNVTFNYSKHMEPIIKEVSFKISAGSNAAIIGKSGSGKSTISKLITGLLQGYSGEILINGININTIDNQTKSQWVSSVSQDNFLFKGSIKDNLCLWDKSITKKKLFAVSKEAYLTSLIDNNKDGFEQEVDEGGHNFSGGQRQQIEIARALTTNPLIMVFDDATSAFDLELEKKFIDSITKKTFTSIFLSQRLSSMPLMDNIIIIDKGSIANQGSHRELMERNCQLYLSLLQEAEYG